MRNKDRLYVAMYARGGTVYMHSGQDRYHWALLVGPKVETEATEAKRYHALEKMTVQDDGTTKSTWQFEAKALPTAPAAGILVRIMISKSRDTKRLQHLLNVENVPIRGNQNQNQQGWNCVAWVKEAIHVLNADGRVLAHPTAPWHQIREASMNFITRKKRQHRFDGKAEQGQFDTLSVPTFDMTLGRETIP